MDSDTQTGFGYQHAQNKEVRLEYSQQKSECTRTNHLQLSQDITITEHGLQFGRPILYTATVTLVL